VAYPLLKYGVAFRLPLSVLTFLAVVIAYVLVIYLFRAISGVVCHGGLWPVLAAGAAAVLAGWMVCHPSQRGMMVSELVMMAGAGTVVGARIRIGDSGSKAYLFGALVVLFGGIGMYAPEWSQLMTLFKVVGRETVDSLAQNLVAFGYHPDAAQAYAGQLDSIVQVMARLTPAFTLVNLLAQFSVAFVWFLARGISAERSAALLAPFVRWRVPFGLMARDCGRPRATARQRAVVRRRQPVFGLAICYCVGVWPWPPVLVRLNDGRQGSVLHSDASDRQSVSP
jgi:hypothetical protein